MRAGLRTARPGAQVAGGQTVGGDVLQEGRSGRRRQEARGEQASLAVQGQGPRGVFLESTLPPVRIRRLVLHGHTNTWTAEHDTH